MSEKTKTKLTLKQLEERTDKSGHHSKPFAVILSDLKSILQRDGTRERAYRHAKISHDTFCRWMNESEEFRLEIEEAEDFMNNLTDNVIMLAVKEKQDPKVALEWKKLRDKRYTTKVESEVNAKVETNESDVLVAILNEMKSINDTTTNTTTAGSSEETD